jgi:hypothetical protein
MDAHWYDVSGFARLSCRVIDHLWWLYASASQGFRARGSQI